MYVRARVPKKAGKWGDTRALQPITVTNKRTGFLGQRISTSQTKSSDFCVNEEKQRLYKGEKKESYNKHLIRRLTSKYGWVLLLVEL